MKKTVFIITMFAVCLQASAQMKIFSDGTGFIGNDTHPRFTNARVNLETTSVITGGKHNIALQSASYLTNAQSSDLAIGLCGIAGNGGQGHTMGILAYLGGSSYGTALYSTVFQDYNRTFSDYYAGFFHGNVTVEGDLTATNFLTSSDLRLKENVTYVGSDMQGGRTYLDRISDLNVITYNLKDRETGLDDSIAATRKGMKRLSEARHIGVIAQEVQQLFPELVYEQPDGYLSVNYVELVPVLIRSVQELKQKVETLENDKNNINLSRTAGIDAATQVNVPAAVLYQNTPNPFTERTTIRFSLPENAGNAHIYVFDMTGKMQKQIPVDASMQSVTINGYELQAGMYFYSLVVNGKEMDTKRMILSK